MLLKVAYNINSQSAHRSEKQLLKKVDKIKVAGVINRGGEITIT